MAEHVEIVKPSSAQSASWIYQTYTYTIPVNIGYVQLYLQVYGASSLTTARFDDGFLNIGTSGGSTPIYYVEDLLGTSRVTTTNTGVVCYDADFYPYGGERPYTNTCPQNYKFEGKERDTETGNDDFGARYYSNRFGRWLSADWSSVPVPVPYANLTNPQTLNLYSMVSDDPESFADLDGHTDDGFWDSVTTFLGAAAGAWLSDNAFGALRPNLSSTEGKLGQMVGDMAAQQTGVAEAEWGAAGRGTALLLAATGQEEVAPEALAVTQGAIVHGAITTTIATANLAKSAVTEPYKRPNNATTQEQRDSVQNKPCATCGKNEGQKNNADHKDPLVEQHYRGGIDKDKMRDTSAVQPQCQSCSNKQGGYLSGFSKALKKLFGF